MSLQQPLVDHANKITTAVVDAKDKAVASVQASRPTAFELAFGTENSTRRYISALAACFLGADSCTLAGRYLERELGPVERHDPRWWPLLAARLIDLLVSFAAWNEVEGVAKRDGALFGAVYAAAARSSLYTLEHAYFLLKAKTTFSIFAIDVLTTSITLALLPRFLPHSVTAKPQLSLQERLRRSPQLLLDLVIAFGLGTCLSATVGFVAERLGGQELVKLQAFDLEVPAVYAAETMTASRMMEHPTIQVPSLRSDLGPSSMVTHLVHSAGISATLTPFVLILSRLTPLGAALAATLAVGPSSLLLFYDVLPIRLFGAVAVALFLAVRAGLVAGTIAWVVDALREPKKVEEIDVVVVDNDTGKIVAAAEVDIIEASPSLRHRPTRA
ncbi:hypothetical protein OIV83_004513 [Microbotryomycetes sp. JL201]|nr:hypothetical protein OIV83_004513 [Microbotryomycetes sp. JL201]